MILTAAFGLAVLLAVADGRPPKKGSASASRAFPAVEPEDYIKTCIDENARACTQVYLHTNGVACKYALVSVVQRPSFKATCGAVVKCHLGQFPMKSVAYQCHEFTAEETSLVLCL